MLCWKSFVWTLPCLALTLIVGLSGCAETSPPAADVAADSATEEPSEEATTELSAEDQALVDAQIFCPVGGKLGGMGTPVKVMVGEKPVFICCEHCREPLLEDPEKYLAELAEKQKKAAEESAPAAEEPTADKEAS